MTMIKKGNLRKPKKSLSDPTGLSATQFAIRLMWEDANTSSFADTYLD
jgi:hypothetical protein